MAFLVVVLVACLLASCATPAGAPAPASRAAERTSPIVVPPPSLGPSSRVVNDRLGYAIQVWAPWRRSACLSSVLENGPELGQDTFTLLTEEQERRTRVTDTGTAALGWLIAVHVETNPNRLSARDWFAGVLAGAAGQQLDDVRVGGRDALRVRNGIFGSLAYVTTSADRAFVVALVPGQAAPPPTASDSYLDAMAASLETLAPVAPAAPPAAVTTAEPFADALADAFARRDVDRLGSLVVPTCWFTSAVANTGPSGIHPQAMLDDLRVRFAQGLTVSVRARPVEGDPARPPLSIRSTWVEAAGASSRGASLLLWRQDGRWYWSGVVFDR